MKWSGIKQGVDVLKCSFSKLHTKKVQCPEQNSDIVLIVFMDSKMFI